MSAKRPLGPNLCSLLKKNESAIHGHLLSRYDQVPFCIFSLKMCSSPISTNNICSLCEVVRAFLHQRDEIWGDWTTLEDTLFHKDTFGKKTNIIHHVTMSA